jgi:hypothetical protein
VLSSRDPSVDLADDLIAETEDLDGVGIEQCRLHQLDLVVDADRVSFVGDAGDKG